MIIRIPPDLPQFMITRWFSDALQREIRESRAMKILYIEENRITKEMFELHPMQITEEHTETFLNIKQTYEDKGRAKTRRMRDLFSKIISHKDIQFFFLHFSPKQCNDVEKFLWENLGSLEEYMISQGFPSQVEIVKERKRRGMKCKLKNHYAIAAMLESEDISHFINVGDREMVNLLLSMKKDGNREWLNEYAEWIKAFRQKVMEGADR